MIADATFETAAALSKQYRTLVESQFQGTCKKCGSTEVTRASSADPKSGIQTHEEGGESGKGASEKLSNQDAMAKLQKQSQFTAGIHGVYKEPNEK